MQPCFVAVGAAHPGATVGDVESAHKEEAGDVAGCCITPRGCQIGLYTDHT